jgi:putative IMPACT (imprinted ancient) family translation regulator
MKYQQEPAGVSGILNSPRTEKNEPLTAFDSSMAVVTRYFGGQKLNPFILIMALKV